MKRSSSPKTKQNQHKFLYTNLQTKDNKTMSKPTVAIHPKRGINDMKLGSYINQHLTSVQSRLLHLTPSDPIILQLVHQNVNLIFDPLRQKLLFVEINISEKVDYDYNGVTLNGKWDINSIYNDIFGPTYNGEAIGDYYILSYPGISFKFKGSNLNELLTKGVLAESCVIHEYKRYSELLKERDNFIRVVEAVEINDVIINEKKDITVRFLVHKKGVKALKLVLNESLQQDILAILGPPDDVFVKDEAKTSIHNDNVIDSKDYVFHNYFKYGFDLLYHNNTLTKFIIHENLPFNKLAFGKYNKCLFTYSNDYKGIKIDTKVTQRYSSIAGTDPIIVNRSTKSQGIEIVNETDISMESLVYVHDDLGIICEVIDHYVDSATFY